VWQVVQIDSEERTTPERPNVAELIRGALTRLGYRPTEAQHAVAALGARVETEPLENLVRDALRALGQRAAPGPKRG
jgi:Holliday junction resolvasome RuvABC DNA-binding subunit